MDERVLIYGNVAGSDRGGVQTVCRRLAAHVRTCGVPVDTLWARGGAESGAPLQTIALPPLVWRRGLPAPRAALTASRALAQLTGYLARLRPTVVNFHYVTSSAAYFLLLRPLFRYRLVLSVHGSDVLRPQADDAPRLARIFQQSDAITTVSDVTTRALQRIASVSTPRVHLIPNGIDVDFWAETEAHGGTPARPVIVSVGRLDPVKGHDVLLRAFATVRTHVPDATLLLIGDGGFRGSLAALAAELGIDAAVTFAGELAPLDVRAQLAAANVFVLPSRSEGLPLALLEAMAAGLPVVAAAVGGVPEVLVPGTGLMVPPEDSASLAEAIASLLHDSARTATMSRCGRERAHAFRADAADLAYTQILRDVSPRPLASPTARSS